MNIILDSTPLTLIVHRYGFKDADQIRAWAANHIAQGSRIFVPEIVLYETRRELLRAGKSKSLRLLERFAASPPGRLLAISSNDLLLAAELWARVRRDGKPTADQHALDIDVILAAQVLNAGFGSGDFIVATSNVSHLSRFVPAEIWSKI